MNFPSAFLLSAQGEGVRDENVPWKKKKKCRGSQKKKEKTPPRRNGTDRREMKGCGGGGGVSEMEEISGRGDVAHEGRMEQQPVGPR